MIFLKKWKTYRVTSQHKLRYIFLSLLAFHGCKIHIYLDIRVARTGKYILYFPPPVCLLAIIIYYIIWLLFGKSASG